MVKTDWVGVVAQKGRKRKDGTQPVAYYYRERRANCKPLWIRMPDDPKSREFAVKYSELTNTTSRLAPTPYSFGTLIPAYLRSSRFSGLADRTKSDYRKHLDMISGWIGEKDAKKFPRSQAIKMRDDNQHRPATANQLLAVMSGLMEHAKDMDWRSDNPVKGVKRLALTGGGYEPWTDIQIDKMRTTDDETALLIFELAMGTGQRPSDLLGMRWNDYQDGDVWVVQGKSGKGLWIPVTSRLRRVLGHAKGRADGLTILSTDKGRPYTYDGIAQRVRKAAKRLGITGVSLHGCRKNATIELAEAGCSNQQIKAITGHATDAMVSHYAKGSRQRELARSARKRTE